jgi:hypothetical protein
MTARLSDELVLELERAGDQPLRVENPRNHKHYLIIAEDRFASRQSEESQPPQTDWTEAKNARRFELIDKELDGLLSPEESGELLRLQHEIDDYLRRVAPLPLSAARELREQLRAGRRC